VVDPWKINISL